MHVKFSNKLLQCCSLKKFTQVSVILFSVILLFTGFSILFHGCSSSRGLFLYSAMKIEIKDTIWGEVIEDPYRWLENPFSEDTQLWLKEQMKFSKTQRGKTFRHMKNSLELNSSIHYKPLIKQGRYFFHFRIEDPRYSPVLYYQERLNRTPTKLFDPNSLRQGRNISIDNFRLSQDGLHLALILSDGRSDWKTIRFFDMQNQELLADRIEHVKYSPIHWSENGIFYIRYEVEDTRESFTGLISKPALYYHKLGTQQSDDLLIYYPGKEFDVFSFEVTPEAKYLVLYHSETTLNQQFNAVSLRNLPLREGETFRPFIREDPNNLNYFNVVGESGGKLLVWTNKHAPNGAIFSYDPNKLNTFDIFIPPFIEMLEYVKMLGNNIIRIYNNGQQSFALISNDQGEELTAWSIPEGYEFSDFSGSIHDNIAIYSFHSFFSPSGFFMINMENLERKQLSPTYAYFDVNDLTTQKVWYPSADGTLIPMYLTHKKNIKLNGDNPTILYGYGGFGISMRPFFNVANLIFLKNGGVLATPALRGGGEFPQWHEMGRRLNKQNTFDDFIAAAEYLISNKYTRPERIAAMGGSNGGLVVGAAMTQRPDLFRVVVSTAGAFDMLRYHLFNIGYVYEEEFGNVNDSIDFVNLRSYSPYHNIREDVNYPTTLLVAGANDDRVLAFHSFKFLARLQEQMPPDRPVVLYFQQNSGHSGSSIWNDHLDQEAYIYSFIFQHLGMNRKARFFFY